MDEEEDRIVSSWKRASEEGQYLSARNGDHMMTPFECDLCIFVKLKGRYPSDIDKKDKKLVACIRRINLDPF